MKAFRKYLNCQNISNIEYIISEKDVIEKTKELFNANNLPQINTLYRIIIDLIRIGDPFVHFNNAITCKSILNIHNDENICKIYGSILKCDDDIFKSSKYFRCYKCSKIEPLYLFYMSYETNINVNSTSFWCYTDMYNIVQYSEQLIQTIYNNILDKYLLSSTLELNVDIINCIFINYMTLLRTEDMRKPKIIYYFNNNL